VIMPTYEYECGACGHRFEKFQSMTAGALRKCPACGRARLRRLIGSGSGVIFKGSGFYQTDYRSAAYRQAAEKEKPSDKAAGAKGSGEKADGQAKGDRPAKKDRPPEKKDAD